MNIPENKDYKPNAWEQYSMEELGHWVALLSKRATHRENPDKKAKDLFDAQAYLNMMQEKLNELK